MRNLLVPFGLKPKNVDGTHYGDINDRIMAAAIDVMLLYLLIGRLSQFIGEKIFAYYGMQPLGYTPNAQDLSGLLRMMWEIRWPWLVSNLLTLLLMGILVVTCQMAYRTTPGKYLFGLKIVKRSTLELPERWRYILRFFGYFLAALPAMIGLLWMNFNRQHRGWQDYVAGTVVISLRPKGWYWKQVKRGYRKLRGLPEPLPVEQPVGEPAAEQGHGDSEKPV